jgi:hypothetical protein
MGDRYTNFSSFMSEVVHEAGERVVLIDIFGLKHERTVLATERVVHAGWWVFLALVGLMAMGVFGFAGAVLAFMLTPPGMVIAGILAVLGGFSIHALYQDRVFPQAVAKVGKKMQPRYKKAQQRYANRAGGYRAKIDQLFETAVEKLINASINR